MGPRHASQPVDCKSFVSETFAPPLRLIDVTFPHTVSRPRPSEEVGIKLDCSAGFSTSDPIHSERPTIPIKFLILVHSSPPHFPPLVLSAVGEDSDT